MICWTRSGLGSLKSGGPPDFEVALDRVGGGESSVTLSAAARVSEIFRSSEPGAPPSPTGFAAAGGVAAAGELEAAAGAEFWAPDDAPAGAGAALAALAIPPTAPPPGGPSNPWILYSKPARSAGAPTTFS